MSNLIIVGIFSLWSETLVKRVYYSAYWSAKMYYQLISSKSSQFNFCFVPTGDSQPEPPAGSPVLSPENQINKTADTSENGVSGSNNQNFQSGQTCFSNWDLPVLETCISSFGCLT